MPTIWRRIAVLLVVVIAVLQNAVEKELLQNVILTEDESIKVIHMTLLSRLEARKTTRQKKDSRNHGWDGVEQDYREAEIQEDRTHMLETIQQSSVLDSSGEFRIINFVIHADILSTKSQVRQDVSLVSQSAINQLYHLHSLVLRWHGPISLAVFSLAKDIHVAVEAIIHLRRCFPAIRHNTSFHLVYPLNSPSYITSSASSLSSLSSQSLVLDSCETLLEKLKTFGTSENYAHGIPYPNNLLRNVARRNAVTEFVFVVDIDMVPSNHLHHDFLNFAKENHLFRESHKDDKTVYVVPAFEIKEGAESPQDKTNLLQLVELMEARPFYFELCWKCQKHTDYEAWQREPLSDKLAVLFEVLWRDPWEPFYIGRNSAPFYDERFRQYGFNRISQVCELHVAGYKFSVLNNAFLVHQGLKTSTSFHKNKESDQEKNRILFRQFKTELKEKYPDSSRKCY